MVQYNRDMAVKYAITYGLKPNPAYRYFPIINNNSGNCSNFISQCLFAGGIPMIFSGENSWWYDNSSTDRKKDTWSVTWTVAHALYWMLKINRERDRFGAKGTETKKIYELQLGDLIFFEDNTGLIFHSAIITAFYYGKPLVSQNSFEAVNIPYDKSWNYSSVHYIKITT